MHNGHVVVASLAGSMGTTAGGAVALGGHNATQQQAASTAPTNPPAIGNPQAAGHVADIPETIPPGAVDIMAKVEPGLINGHLVSDVGM